MRTIYVISFFVLLVISSRCGKDVSLHNQIIFNNNSDVNLCIYADFWHPDTAINFSYPNPAVNSEYHVPKNTEKDVLTLRDTYEWRFKQFDTLMIFVFDTNVIESTPWETVQEDYLILKRYDLSIDDLNQMNWTITYP